MESKDLSFNCHNWGFFFSFFFKVCHLLEEASLVGFNFRCEMHPQEILVSATFALRVICCLKQQLQVIM